MKMKPGQFKLPNERSMSVTAKQYTPALARTGKANHLLAGAWQDGVLLVYTNYGLVDARQLGAVAWCETLDVVIPDVSGNK